MSSPIEDYAAHRRRPDGGPRPSKWIDRLVMLAAFRQRCLFLRLARRGRQRALEHRPERSGGFHQPALRGRHARPRNRCPDAGRHRAPDDFMPIRQGDLSAVIRMVEGLSGSVGMAMDLRLRFDYGSLPPWCEAASDGVTARIGSNQVCARSTVPVAIEGDALTAAFTVSAGRRFAFVPRLFGRPRRSFRCRPVESQGARPRHGARRDAPLLARLDRAFRYVENAVAGRSQAILDHATRHDPSGDGRPRGCADHQPSRGACRRLELGLSLLLAAGRDVHARCFRQCGLHR